MGGQDAAFLYGETPTWHMHVSALMLVDPRSAPDFSFERVRDLTAERLPQLPQFRWRLVEVPFGVDRPGWVEERDFDIDYHVRRIGIPSPGGRAELGELVGRLAGYKLNRDKPLWEMWFIEGLEDGLVAVLTKMHHAIVDGVSGAGLAEITLDLEREPRAQSLEVHEPLHHLRQPSSVELLARGLASTAILTPVRVARFGVQAARQTFTTIGFMRRTESPVAPFQAPRTTLNGEFTAHRQFSSSSVSLDRAKAVKNAFGLKLNDVVLAACAGALRRYLASINDLPAEPLVAQVPVSLRTDADKGEVGNKIGTFWASLATDIDDPSERIAAIAQSTANAKEMREALSAQRIMGLTDTTPPGLISLAARMYSAAGLDWRSPPVFNVIISNVPGPPFPLYLAGAPLQAMYPMGPLLFGGALNITVMSYCGSLDFGFLSCPEAVPDLDFIADGIPLALAELEAAAGIGPVTEPGPEPEVAADAR